MPTGTSGQVWPSPAPSLALTHWTWALGPLSPASVEHQLGLRKEGRVVQCRAQEAKS